MYTSNEKNFHEQKFSFNRFFIIFQRNDWWLCSFLDVRVYIHRTYDQYLRVLKAWEVWRNGGQLGPTDLYWVDSNSQKLDEKVKFLGGGGGGESISWWQFRWLQDDSNPPPLAHPTPN